MSIDYTGLTTPSKKLIKLFVTVPDDTRAYQASIQPPALPAPAPVAVAPIPGGTGATYIKVLTAAFSQDTYNQLLLKYDGRVSYVAGEYWAAL